MTDKTLYSKVDELAKLNQQIKGLTEQANEIKAILEDYALDNYEEFFKFEGKGLEISTSKAKLHIACVAKLELRSDAVQIVKDKYPTLDLTEEVISSEKLKKHADIVDKTLLGDYKLSRRFSFK